MERKTIILLSIVILATTISIACIYWRSMIMQDFDIIQGEETALSE